MTNLITTDALLARGFKRIEDTEVLQNERWIKDDFRLSERPAREPNHGTPWWIGWDGIGAYGNGQIPIATLGELDALLNDTDGSVRRAFATAHFAKPTTTQFTTLHWLNNSLEPASVSGQQGKTCAALSEKGLAQFLGYKDGLRQFVITEKGRAELMEHVRRELE
jgi:hypothetical protein